MRYFIFEKDKNVAIKKWNNSQYDLTDIVLSLTDQNIELGVKIYSIFIRLKSINFMQYFICDFNKIKTELGIVYHYATREGDIYSKDFNPKRNYKALSLTKNEMEKIAKRVYTKLIQDLETIGSFICDN